MYVQQIDIQRMQNITGQLRDNQSRKNDSIPLSALTYNAPAGYAPLTTQIYIYICTRYPKAFDTFLVGCLFQLDGQSLNLYVGFNGWLNITNSNQRFFNHFVDV